MSWFPSSLFWITILLCGVYCCNNTYRVHALAIPHNNNHNNNKNNNNDDLVVSPKGNFPPSSLSLTYPFHTPESYERPIRIDLRSTDDFQKQGHFQGSASLPLKDLQQRLFQVPPPGEWPLQLIGKTRQDVNTAKDLLYGKGWYNISEFVIFDHDNNTNIYGGDDPNDEWVVETTTTTESAPLWRPNVFLAAILDHVRINPPPSSSSSSSHDGDDISVAVDLGCGSGRDTVALAQHLGPGWKVIGIDEHGNALNRGRELAKQVLSSSTTTCDDKSSPSGAAQIDFVKLDLRKHGLDFLTNLTTATTTSSSQNDDTTNNDNGQQYRLRLVHGCRFLYRPLLEALPSLLEPGGLVIYSHFEDPLPDDGPPPAPPFRPSRRLQRNEMRCRLLGEEQGFGVIVDDHGEMITRNVAVPSCFYAARKL